MVALTSCALVIGAWADAIGKLHSNRKAIKWFAILVKIILKRTWHRFRGTVLPIPDDALAY